MRRSSCLIGAAALAAIASPAAATTVLDPVGDFLPSYTFVQSPDLDVTSFSVNYNRNTAAFTLSATFAGAIDPATAGLYVIGYNNGTGTNHPFDSIGQPNVIFNQAITVLKTGVTTVNGTTLAATIDGNGFSVVVPLSALLQNPAVMPQNWGFNLWPRIGTGGGNAQIADFAPENALLAALPEPAAWMLMIGGFGAIGGTVRRRPRHALA